MNRKQKGKDIINKMFGETAKESRAAFKEMGEITSDYLFGEIWSRDGLELRDRSLITVAILATTGKEMQLKTHLKGALNNGLSVDQLKEVMIHTAHYAGWPSAMNGLYRMLSSCRHPTGRLRPARSRAAGRFVHA